MSDTRTDTLFGCSVCAVAAAVFKLYDIHTVCVYDTSVNPVTEARPLVFLVM